MGELWGCHLGVIGLLWWCCVGVIRVLCRSNGSVMKVLLGFLLIYILLYK